MGDAVGLVLEVWARQGDQTMVRFGFFALAAAVIAVSSVCFAAPVEKVGGDASMDDAVARAVRMQRVSDCMSFLEENQKDITAVLYFLKQSNNFKKESFCSQMISRSDNHDAATCYQLFDQARNAANEPLTLGDFEEAMGNSSFLENPTKTCNILIPALQ